MFSWFKKTVRNRIDYLKVCNFLQECWLWFVGFTGMTDLIYFDLLMTGMTDLIYFDLLMR